MGATETTVVAEVISSGKTAMEAKTIEIVDTTLGKGTVEDFFWQWVEEGSNIVIRAMKGGCEGAGMVTTEAEAKAKAETKTEAITETRTMMEIFSVTTMATVTEPIVTKATVVGGY